jgi:transposase
MALCNWLKHCQIETIAMESTRVYWIPLFQMLERSGFEVRLVNASHVKNVPGRKTDVKDCQWLQELHTFGMLRGSFRPEGRMCVVRSYLRLRDTLSKDCNSLVQRMQKALTEMNVQIHRVLSDITGLTGMHLLQVSLVYVNTLMIQQVLAEPHWQDRLTTVDLRALSPLKWQHVNPYGTFTLNMRERLPLEAREPVTSSPAATCRNFELR